MYSRTRLPFWTTTVSMLALGACIRQAEPDVVVVDEPRVVEKEPIEETIVVSQTTSTDPGLSGRDIGGTRDHEATPTEQPEAEYDEIASVDDGDAGESGPMRTESKPADNDRGRYAKSEPAREPMYYTAPTPPPVAYRPAPTPSPTPHAGVAAGATGMSMPITTSSPPRVDLPDATANTETYTDYGINDFVIVEKDPLSTFAIDVDTASYTVSRRKLVEGYLPPESAVRVEEYVNYFPYEYKQPKAGDPFAVDFEAAPSPWNSRNTIVRVGVQGKKLSMDERDPVHLTFLVDVSGSMRGEDRIELVKKSLIMLTEELEDGDTVAIATYAGSTDIVLQPTPVSRKGDIIRAVERLYSGGSTAMGAGIDLAYGLADQTFVDDTVNRVIICSDGDANVGQTSHEALSQQIKKYAAKGITLTTLGFGNGNYKDTMMEQLANDGDGNYFYIDSEIEARRVLVDKMTSTLEVIAKDVKIQVDWNPGAVVAYRLIGYENRDVADVDFRNDKVDAGEIGAGHQVTALYEVALKDDPTGTIATVRVRNKAPGPDAPATERSFALDASAIRGATDESSDQFRIALASASFAEILRGSPHMAEVTLRDVEALARGAARPEYREDAELVELIGRAATLRGESATYSSLH